jgi:poly(A) polymerase
VGEKKPRLRTSKEVYDLLRWDPRRDPRDYVIGYGERLAATGTAEIPLIDFEPDGEVPWHRVLYVRGPRGVVWDRRERLDRLDEG